jgi:hypothetical protein
VRIGAEARGKGKACPIAVAKLDRLSRDVHFINGLMVHRVFFIVGRARRRRKSGATTLRAIAEVLNARGIPTPRGRKWEAMSVKNALARG